MSNKNPASVAELSPADYNPRTITEKRSAQLAKSMARFGDLSGITYNKRTGRLVGGHQRVKHLPANAKITRRTSKDKTGTIAIGNIGAWSYREVDWDEATEKAANIAANAAGGDFDNGLLRGLVQDLDKVGFDLDSLNLDNLEQILDSLVAVEEDDVPDSPKIPICKPGDIWKLGEHRLLCGDSTSVQNVKRLMDGENASLMWTDPPYGVEYVGKTKKALTIENDGAGGLPALLSGAFEAADCEAMADGCSIYIAHPAGALSMVFGDAFRSIGWNLHQTLIWVKDSMVLGHSDYHFRHEPIIHGYKPGSGRHGRGGNGWYGSDKETSVLEFARPKRSEDHPTMKPVDLVAYCIGNSSPRGGVVYDPFLGSGSTLIAAEKMGRICYGLELSPKFCDVIIKRFEQVSGQKAERC